MTEDDAFKLLKEAVALAGSQRAFARAHGFSPAFLNDVLQRRRGISDAICRALRIERHVTYSTHYTETTFKPKCRPKRTVEIRR